MTMAGELCRDVAFEAVRRGARVSPHELWAALEDVDDLHPGLVVDIGSGPALWWAWWSIGARVVAVAAVAEPPGPVFGRDRYPVGVDVIVADRRDRATVLRVRDQAGAGADVVALAAAVTEDECRADFAAYGPLVRRGGLVVVQGIADPERPGIASFWSGLVPAHTRELVGTDQPVGFGIVEIHGKEQSHG